MRHLLLPPRLLSLCPLLFLAFAHLSLAGSVTKADLTSAISNLAETLLALAAHDEHYKSHTSADVTPPSGGLSINILSGDFNDSLDNDLNGDLDSIHIHEKESKHVEGHLKGGLNFHQTITSANNATEHRRMSRRVKRHARAGY